MHEANPLCVRKTTLRSGSSGQYACERSLRIVGHYRPSLAHMCQANQMRWSSCVVGTYSLLCENYLLEKLNRKLVPRCWLDCVLIVLHLMLLHQTPAHLRLFMQER